MTDDLTRDEDLSDETKSPEDGGLLSSSISPGTGPHAVVHSSHQLPQQQQHLVGPQQHQQQILGPSVHLQAQELYHHHLHNQYTAIKQEPYTNNSSSNSCAAGLVHS
jgi:hypothetical protein